jgi:hypothetical protein
MTEQEWLSIFKEWETSALPQREFCAKHKLSYVQFTAWRSKLISRGLVERKQPESLQPAKPTLSFIPLSLNTKSAKPASQLRIIEVCLPQGIMLRIPVDANG